MRPALVLPVALGALVLLLGGGALVTLGATTNPRQASAAASLIGAGVLQGSRSVGADFGLAVAVSANGRVALVGGPRDKKSKGAAWVFTRSGAAWSEQIKLTGGSLVGSEFGSSVALSGNGRVAIVGAPLASGKKGAAWIFTSAGGGSPWVGTKLTAKGESGQGVFGSSVALSGDGKKALVGGPGDGGGKGAAWIFKRSGTKWVQLSSKLTGGGATAKARFGASVALSFDSTTAFVGGPTDSNDQGAAWAFTPSGSSWKQLGKKLTSNYAKSKFGSSVALAGDGYTALVGAPTAPGGGSNPPTGAAWLLRRQGATWSRQQLSGDFPARLEATGRRSVGRSVALSSDGLTAVVGGAFDNRFNTIVAGAAWVFARSGSAWRQQGEAFTYGTAFGVSIALSEDGTIVLIGRGENDRPDLYPSWVSVLAPVPVVGGITPIRGPSAGGTQVTITGENFIKVRGVRFDATPAASFKVDSPTQITAVSPPGQAGDVHIRVANSFGTSAERQGGFLSRAADLFTYDPPPRPPEVTAVNPASGPTGGGTEVTITGSGFFFPLGSTVKFGANAAARIAAASFTQLIAVSPPGQAGPVDVTVTTAYGTSATSAADRFTYVGGRPAVTGVSPASGPTGGGTQVTIAGSDFTGASAVRFGATTAASFTVNSATQIRATSPPGQAGTVDITVTTPGGTSATSAADRFTYLAPVTQQVISFDNLTTGGPGGALVTVDSQYAGQGVSFNSVKAIDYSKGSAIAGFARSGTVGIEQCVGVEFCTTPLRAIFSAPRLMVRVWVGFSFPLNQPLQVQLRALNGATVVGTANATLPANASPTPIRTALEVQIGTASITSVEVSVPGGYNSALAVDDVTFAGP